MTGNFHRRSIRLAGYDYSEAGLYFVTICTFQKKCILGEIAYNEMRLSEFGKIASDQWKKIPERFGNVELGEFVVMPNHVHGILILHDWDDLLEDSGQGQALPVRVPLAGTLPPLVDAPAQKPAPTLGDIVGAYKSLVANECLKISKGRNQVMGKLWHRNYYEHIIMSDEEYDSIAAYIEFNPENWVDKDEYY